MPFLEPPTWVGANQAVVDGEVIALDERGEPKVAPDDCETHAA